MPVPPTTPLRRVSHGSLYALARSQSLRRSTNAKDDPYVDPSDPTAPSDLEFLAPALSELADEADALLANARRAARTGDALRRFNEGFAAYMYALDMNALTTYWPQAPNDASRVLADRRAEEDARLADEAARAAARPPSPSPAAADFTLNEDITIMRDQSEGDMSYAPGNLNMTGATSRSGDSSTTRKKGVKQKLSAKERKERGVLIERVFGHLPLAFRGNDPNLRRNMEAILERLLDEPTRGFRLQDFVAPPDINEARARKCVLALASAKLTRSDNSTGTALHHWVGLPNR